MYYYKFVTVVYEEITYKNTIFVSGNFWINIKTYLFA
jgi:hypothetical protein